MSHDQLFLYKIDTSLSASVKIQKHELQINVSIINSIKHYLLLANFYNPTFKLSSPATMLRNKKNFPIQNKMI